MNWIKISETPPPRDVVVHTRIEDEKGIRNEQDLLWWQGLWWHPDKSMYVYYTPTHWK